MRKWKKKIYKFIAIDYGISSPGLCFTDRTKPEGFTCISYKTPKKESYEHRILRFEDYANILINEIPYTITNSKVILMIEDYAAGSMGRTNDIAEATGILKYKLLVEYGIAPKRLQLCAIPHLKMFVCGKGNAKKELVLKEVYKRWGFDTNSNDQADAFVMWKILTTLYHENNDLLTKYQKDIISRIRKYNEN
jgi:Holliday junction resolvasome RuvABC endonuclease subunit